MIMGCARLWRTSSAHETFLGKSAEQPGTSIRDRVTWGSKDSVMSRHFLYQMETHMQIQTRTGKTRARVLRGRGKTYRRL